MNSRTTSSWSGSLRSLLALTLLAGCVADEEPAAPFEGVAGVEAVDPFVATGGVGFLVGSATPAATVPFGLVKLGPDTSLDWGRFDAYHCSGYYYDDDHIEGFSHLHLHGVGVPDYGSVLFAPVDGWNDARTHEDGYRQRYDKSSEAARPGWYEVTLENGIEVALTATTRTGWHRYTFPEGVDPVVLLDLEHVLAGTNLGGEVTLDPEAGTLSGYMTNAGPFTRAGFPVYFHAEVEGGFTTWGTWGDDAPTEGRAQAAGMDLGAWFVPARNPVELRVGISLVSLDGARANLAAEAGATMEAVATAARQDWEALLDRVQITGADPEEATIFASALYHLLQMPTVQTDVDGRYRGIGQGIHTADGWTYHSDFSMWDTYRTAHPAFTLLYPDHARDFARSLVAMAEQGGAFPRWPAASHEGGSMLGQPATIVLADTWLKGVEDWDVDGALDRLVAQQSGALAVPYNAPPDPSLLDRYGYYPSDLVGESVAENQELAWADDALANLAQARGRSAEAAWFEHRSYTPLAQFDPAQGFFHGRRADGTFEEDLNPIAWEDEYVEGNAWQYLWMPPARAAEIAALLGGEEAARARLTAFFEGAVDEGLIYMPPAYYWHGNEPDIHAAFLFALWGDRDATVRWQRWIEDERYFARPDGLAGNDDAGTLSAWYLFSTLGFYPIAGTDQYVLGAPRFPEARFRLGDGWFTVRRVGEGTHVVRTTLDGVEITGPLLRHHQLREGGELVVELSE